MDKKINKMANELLRKELALIDLDDIGQDKPISDKEAKEIAGAVEGFYKRYFEKQLKKMIQTQLEFSVYKATIPEQWIMGKGTLNGLLLVKKWFDDKISLSRSTSQPKEEIDENEL